MKKNVQTIVSKEAVLLACKVALKEFNIGVTGTGVLNATECYGLVLNYVHEEMCESCEVDLDETSEEKVDQGVEADAELLKSQRRTVFMFTWMHYPKNPSAFRQAFFKKDDGSDGVEAPSLVAKYSF